MRFEISKTVDFSKTHGGSGFVYATLLPCYIAVFFGELRTLFDHFSHYGRLNYEFFHNLPRMCVGSVRLV